ncbi:hypothetical protein CR513_20876, partial [Mucuna pruriens]
MQSALDVLERRDPKLVHMLATQNIKTEYEPSSRMQQAAKKIREPQITRQIRKAKSGSREGPSVQRQTDSTPPRRMPKGADKTKYYKYRRNYDYITEHTRNEKVDWSPTLEGGRRPQGAGTWKPDQDAEGTSRLRDVINIIVRGFAGESLSLARKRYLCTVNNVHS